MSTMIQGQAIDADLPQSIGINAIPPSGIRITAILIPMRNGQHACEEATAAAVPLTGGTASITIDRVQADMSHTLHVLATRNGFSVTLAKAGDVYLEINAPSGEIRYRLSATGSRTVVATEIYRRSECVRLRVVDQGHADGWNIYSTGIGCPFTLEEVLDATASEHEKLMDAKESDEASKQVPSNLVKQPDKPRKKRTPRNSPAPNTGPLGAPCHMLYFSQTDGSSQRTVIIVSVKNGSMWARAVDGRQVKQFKITGVRDLVDADTGEDALPSLHALAAQLS